MSMTREEFETRIVAKAASDSSFYQALLSDPKGTLQKELQEIKSGVTLPADLKVSVVEESANQIYLRLPARHSDQLSDADLSSVSGGTGHPPQPAMSQVAISIDMTAVSGGPTVTAVVLPGRPVVLV